MPPGSLLTSRYSSMCTACRASATRLRISSRGRSCRPNPNATSAPTVGITTCSQPEDATSYPIWWQKDFAPHGVLHSVGNAAIRTGRVGRVNRALAWYVLTPPENGPSHLVITKETVTPSQWPIMTVKIEVGRGNCGFICPDTDSVSAPGGQGSETQSCGAQPPASARHPASEDLPGPGNRALLTSALLMCRWIDTPCCQMPMLIFGFVTLVAYLYGYVRICVSRACVSPLHLLYNIILNF